MRPTAIVAICWSLANVVGVGAGQDAQHLELTGWLLDVQESLTEDRLRDRRIAADG